MGKSGSKSGTIIAVAALLVVAVLGLAWLSQPTEVRTALEEASISEPGGTGEQPAAPAAVSAQETSGELELFLKNAIGGTGVSSKVLLLDPTVHAKYDKDGKFDPVATRYSIMEIHYNKGLDGLTSVNGGTAKDISVSSGEWSETQLKGKIGDKVLIYTYVDTSPAAGENASTAHLLTLINYKDTVDKWVFQDENGDTAWNLYGYASYDMYDGTDTTADSLTYGDGGSADANTVNTWYSRSSQLGEKCVDCYVYLKAPSNITGKFKSLSISDKSGKSVKFTTLSKAENFAGDDPRGIAGTLLTAANYSDYYWYYVGDISSLNTLYDAGDKNRLTWELTTDTYGKDIIVTFAVIENAKALISNNGGFTIADDIDFRYSDGSSSGYNVAP